jgi:hypothetical protein
MSGSQKFLPLKGGQARAGDPVIERDIVGAVDQLGVFVLGRLWAAQEVDLIGDDLAAVPSLARASSQPLHPMGDRPPINRCSDLPRKDRLAAAEEFARIDAVPTRDLADFRAQIGGFEAGGIALAQPRPELGNSDTVGGIQERQLVVLRLKTISLDLAEPRAALGTDRSLDRASSCALDRRGGHSEDGDDESDLAQVASHGEHVWLKKGAADQRCRLIGRTTGGINTKLLAVTDVEIHPQVLHDRRSGS